MDKESPLVTANEIREYIFVAVILPARRRGKKNVIFTSADIHNGMGLKGYFPLVCSSVDARKFLNHAKVSLITRNGPKQSSTVRWTFTLD